MEPSTKPLIEGEVVIKLPDVEWVPWGEICDSEWMAFAVWYNGESVLYVNRGNPEVSKVTNERT